MGFGQSFVFLFLLWQNTNGQQANGYGQIGSGGPVSDNGQADQLPVIVLNNQRGGQPSGQGSQSLGQNIGIGSQFGPSVVRPILQNADFGPSPINFGQERILANQFSFGQEGSLSNRLFGQSGGPSGQIGSGQGVSRVIQAPLTPTVTKTVTLDRFVTLTDLAYHSIPVTLTDLVIRTTTITSRQVVQTATDDLVAIQTTEITLPTSVTVTCTKFDYRIVTEVSVAHFTVTHTSYIIRQMTYTTTVTQVSTYPATMVRTIIRTQRTTMTDYRTITNIVHGYY